MLNNYKKIQDKILPSLSAFALLNASVFSGIVSAQSQATVEEIVVTARKKAESLQDVPLSVSALREETLEQRGINVFEDYLLQMPGITAGGSGPGQSTIYIRGLASTTPNLTTAGVAGLAPNVSFYLDEQPLAQPGRNLDVYAADISRIEVLSGPQGTLFGASSQAGVVRMITNKPVIGDRESNVEVETRFSPEGDPGSKFEAVTNIPLGDRSAVRLVAYKDKRGGYIDQVEGSIDITGSARFRTTGTVRQNGVPVADKRKGKQAGANLAGVTIKSAEAIVQGDVNDVEYAGYRASLLHEINDNWSALVSYSNQTIESDGIFMADPTLGDLEVQRYADDHILDEYDNMSLTIEGNIGDLEVIYAGAYTDRKTDQNVDYTDYLFVSQYLPYYICDSSVSYPGAAAPSGTCHAPDMDVVSNNDIEITSHEFRVNTPVSDSGVSATFGAFMSESELKELNFFNYYGSPFALNAAGVAGWTTADNYPHTNPQTGTTGGNTTTFGYYSVPGPYSAPTLFWNDILRTDEQFGAFGEVNYELSDEVELTLGARYYDIEVDFEGSANSSFYNFGATTESNCCGANLSQKFGPNNTEGNPDKAVSDGTIVKATAKWTPEDGKMYYVTYSEGFRPGILNRKGGATDGAGYTVPNVVDSDTVTNYEFGWKTIHRDGTLRFNGSMFLVDIEGLQTTIFDPNITNLFFSDNAGDAEIFGIEGDFAYFTEIDGLSVSGAFSMLDSELTKKLVPTNDVVVGQDLAFAPAFQGNLNVRYEWGLSNGDMAHFMPQITYSDDSYSDVILINRSKNQSYAKVDVRLGVSNDDFTTEFYIENLTDERAEISRNFVFDKEYATYMRPMTIGIRYKRNF
jgi:outer membrane receptor protein involved in Fe transport